MPSPVLPQDFLALLPNSSNGACNEIDKMTLQTPQTLLDLAEYLFNENGTVTTEFATDICAALVLIGCAGGTTSTTTAGTGTTTTTTTTTDAISTVWYAGARVELYGPPGLNGALCDSAEFQVAAWFAGWGTFGTVTMGNGLRTEINNQTPIWTGTPAEIHHHRILAWNPSTTELWSIYQARRQDRTEGVSKLSYIDRVTKATGVAVSAVGVGMLLDAEYYSAVWNPAGTVLYAARGSKSSFPVVPFEPGWASNLVYGAIVRINTTTGAESSEVEVGISGNPCRIYAMEYAGSTLYCIGFDTNLFFGTVNPDNGVVVKIVDITLSEGNFIDWYYAGADKYGQLSTTLCLLYKSGVMHLLVMDGGCPYKNLYSINVATGDMAFLFPIGTDGAWDPADPNTIGTMPLYLEAGA